MIIRKATPADSQRVASCLLLDREEILYRMIGDTSQPKAYYIMLHFVKGHNNQYSYTNCWVAEEEGVVIAAANVYDGGQLSALRQPVIDYLRTYYGFTRKIEDETKAGEYYLDSLGVLPKRQGRGIGSALFTFLVEEYVTRRKKHSACWWMKTTTEPGHFTKNRGLKLLVKRCC